VKSLIFYFFIIILVVDRGRSFYGVGKYSGYFAEYPSGLSGAGSGFANPDLLG